VLGVDTLDEANEGVSKLTELGVSFPSVWDFTGRVLSALPVRRALPVTVFVRADGSVAKVYQAQGFNEATLRAAIKTYLGVDA